MKNFYVFLLFFLNFIFSFISSQNISNGTSIFNKIKSRNLNKPYLKLQLNLLKKLGLFESWSNFTYYPILYENVCISLDFIVEQNWFDEAKSIKTDSFLIKGLNVKLELVYSPLERELFLQEKVLRNLDAKLKSVNKLGGRRYIYEPFVFSLMYQYKSTIYSPFTIKYTLKNELFVFKTFQSFSSEYCQEKITQKIKNFNLLFSNTLLGFHYINQRKNKLVSYEEAINKRNNLILDGYEYYKYVGRISEIMPSMYIFFLRVLDEKTNTYTYPFRLFNQRYAIQEINFIKMSQDEIRDAFQLNFKDKEWTKIFDRLQGESFKPSYVYISTILLESLRNVFELTFNLTLYKRKDSPDKISYQTLYKRMVNKFEGVYGRVIFGNILTDFTSLIKPRKLIYGQFNSELILNWLCLGFDNNENYIGKSVLIPCKFKYRNEVGTYFNLPSINYIFTIPDTFEGIDPVTWPNKDFETEATVRYTYNSADMQLKKIFYPKTLFIESSAKNLLSNKLVILIIPFLIFVYLIN